MSDWNGNKTAVFVTNGDVKQFNSSSAVCYAWFIWQKGNKEKPVIDWI